MYTFRINGGLTMWNDPIIEETRKLREQYAKKFNHDIDIIFEDIQKGQKKNKKKLFSFTPRKFTSK